ncbi:hypothetical protein BGZ65_006414 [Modicella reniformis]|uniref:Uncharacterized protein n=1 Tax=Modicella reniformis TaxID=1440133 RepID=A0A9P6IPZ6_9FUNG|nr:hypothetical protein BGZ65_006414 [Modicella reniformis]
MPHLLAGDFEGHVGLWDLTRAEVPLSYFKAHEDVVNCMDGAGSLSGRPEFVTGGVDGTVKLWDTRLNHKETSGGSSPISNMSLKKGREDYKVWCVALGGPGSDTEATGSGVDDLLVVAGYDNGDVRVMDIRFPQGNGVTQEVVEVQSGDDSTLWQACHIPQRPGVVAVSDGGGQIHLFQHGDDKTLMKPLGSHKAASEAMISLDFNEDLEGLYVGCDLDSTLRVGMVHL